MAWIWFNTRCNCQQTDEILSAWPSNSQEHESTSADTYTSLSDFISFVIFGSGHDRQDATPLMTAMRMGEGLLFYQRD